MRASTLILGPVREAGVGARTAEEVGVKVPPFVATQPAVPGPGRALRASMDRFPGAGPAMNRAAGVDKTMRKVADYREREVKLAMAERPLA